MSTKAPECPQGTPAHLARLRCKNQSTFIIGAANVMNMICAYWRSGGFNEVVFFLGLNSVMCTILLVIVGWAHWQNRGKPPFPKRSIPPQPASFNIDGWNASRSLFFRGLLLACLPRSLPVVSTAQSNDSRPVFVRLRSLPRPETLEHRCGTASCTWMRHGTATPRSRCRSRRNPLRALPIEHATPFSSGERDQSGPSRRKKSV